jgi:UDP-N-acetylglucosamine--N-acetylmuramyl-(pentapeptide) pyrophosphoryl-undecaprenol N-acetylglucosamine transferase
MLIAGGGTGGHLFPGVAVAAELKALRPALRLAFVSTGKALESEVLARAGYALEPLTVRAFRGAGLVDRLRSLAALPGAVLDALAIIKKYGPAAVLAVGGYAAFPLGVAAWLKGVPLLVQEQNAVPGLTNRLLSRLAKTVFISFAVAEERFPAGKSILAGNPVRGDLLEDARAAADERPDPAATFRVLVLGGSQGAHSLNQAVCAALPRLAGRRPRLFITHQTGSKDEAEVQNAYGRAGQPGQVAAFFNDVGRQYGLAHLCLCRAGAGTACELAAIGRAAVLVPYPFAAGDHQTANAQALAQAGAAVLVPDAELSGDKVAALIAGLMDDPGRLADMEAASAALGRPEAAREIALACLGHMKEAA